ncbi:MAG: TRAP transporter substrate-binding protein [Candidatus Velthaea sp.]
MANHHRKAFLAGSAAAFASVAFVRWPGEAAEFNYKFGHQMAIGHPLQTSSVQMWNAVRNETNGRLKVAVFPANTLGSDPATMTQIRAGAVQFAAISGSTMGSVVPASGIESLPFAFKNSADVFRAMDGVLGQHIRRDMATKDVFGLPFMYELGFREVSSSTHPIRTVDDLANFKIRVPASKIITDTFATLGASPVTLGTSEIYTGLQTHVADGQETPYSVIETLRLFEVQKYLSATNHIWTGVWVVANPAGWNALPPDVRAVVLRNQEKYALQQRRDVQQLNAALIQKLVRRGMVFNIADVDSFKPKLGAFYGRWREEFGPEAWSLLEKAVGKIA